jgi:transcriptional regulator with XRE-family HTH domain
MKAKKESFAARLNRLFEEKRKADGTQYTQTEVVEGTKGIVTRVYLWKLLTGRAANPGLRVIRVLAEFFGVDPSYFFDGDDIKTALAMESQGRDAFLDQIALRSPELDDHAKQAVLNMIESILNSKK